MALTTFRWIAAAIAGCLMVSVVILREVPDPWSNSWGALDRRLEYQSRHAAAAGLRLRAAQVVDSVEAADRRADGDLSIHVWHDAALPATTVAAVDRLVARASADVRDTGKVGLDIDLVYDTVSVLRGVTLRRYGTLADYVLPSRAGESCRVIVHLHEDAGQSREQSALATRSASEALLGPCRYYRAFGMPGPHIEAWLKARAAHFAGGGSWQQAAAPVNLEQEWSWYAAPFEVLMGSVQSRSLQNELWTDAVQCMSGLRDQCEHSVVAWNRRREPFVFRGNILVQDYPPLGLGWGGYEFRAGAGRREPALLADMVVELGRDKFGRFWRSDASVPVAFQAAAGTSIGDWMFNWLGAKYGPMPARGAGITTAAAVASVVLILLFVGIALRVSERRQFA